MITEVFNVVTPVVAEISYALGSTFALVAGYKAAQFISQPAGKRTAQSILSQANGFADQIHVTTLNKAGF